MNRDTDIAAHRDAHRKVYDTGLARLLTAIWGGNLHMGQFASPHETLALAQVRLKDHMARAAGLAPEKRVIEAGCGIGTTARHVAKRYGVSVFATNISEAQLEQARAATEKEGLADRVSYGFADYHELGVPDRSFDCWWCQEALLYAVDKRKVLAEARRVIRPGGRIAFTDLLTTRAMPEAERLSFTTAIMAPSMWTIEDWDALVADMSFPIVERQDWREHTAPTFEAVAANLAKVRNEFIDLIGREAVESTEFRINLQLEKARAGKLGWCLFALGT